MKTQKMPLWQWIRSLFVRSKKQNESAVNLDNKDYFQEVDWSKFQEHQSNDQENQDVTENEKTKPYYTNHKIFSLFVNGKQHNLTQKQFTFYTIIKKLQKRQINNEEKVYGKDIMLEFYKMKYPELSVSQLKKKLPPSKLHFSNYGVTTKYLYKSGLLTKLKNNYYKVEE